MKEIFSDTFICPGAEMMTNFKVMKNLDKNRATYNAVSNSFNLECTVQNTYILTQAALLSPVQ